MAAEWKKVIPSVVGAVAIIVLGWTLELTTKSEVTEMIDHRSGRYTDTDAAEDQARVLDLVDNVTTDLKEDVKAVDTKVDVLHEAVDELTTNIAVQTVILDRIEKELDKKE